MQTKAFILRMVEGMMEETWGLDSLVDFHTSPGLPSLTFLLYRTNTTPKC